MKYIKGDFITVPNKKALAEVSHQAQVTFLWLCAFANEEGICFPSTKLLKERSNISRSALFEALSELEIGGFISRTKRVTKSGISSNEYQIKLISKIKKQTALNKDISVGVVQQVDGGVVQQVDGGSSSGWTTPSPAGGHELYTVEVNPVLSKNNINNINIISEKKEKTINDFIGLFQELLPGDFIGRNNAFAKVATREAISGFMKLYSFEQATQLVDSFTSRKNEQYAPTVGSVYEFCTLKLAKIESFLNKKENKSPVLGDFGVKKEKVMSEQERDLITTLKNRVRIK